MIGRDLNLSGEEDFPPRPCIVVHDVGTVMCVES